MSNNICETCGIIIDVPNQKMCHNCFNWLNNAFTIVKVDGDKKPMTHAESMDKVLNILMGGK
jgi:hypothetical protein